MKNLKIKVFLENKVILNRFLSIDSILINLHYNYLRKQGKLKKDEFIDVEKDLNNLKFIEQKNGILSGSIWYLSEDSMVIPENIIFRKTVNEKPYIKYTNKKSVDTSRGEFKAYSFGIEALHIPELYFYVRGDKDYISKLLNNLKYIGKKSSIGCGTVKKVEIEEIAEDKSFYLNETTPSKPLPCDKFHIKTKKVAFYRSLPPYNLKKDLKACYMPTTSLIERADNSFNSNFKVETINNYISSSAFAKLYGDFGDIDEVRVTKPKKVEITSSNKDYCCLMCGDIQKSGIKGNPKDIFPKTFNDYPFLDNGEFICMNCFWGLKKEKDLGNSFISKDKVFYLQGKNLKDQGLKTVKEQQQFRDKFFRNIKDLKPPFLISLKSTANTQHTIFKNKVSISNAIVSISFGDEVVLVDVELLNEAIVDLENILKTNKCLTKLHFINFEQISEPYPKLKKDCNTLENIKLISEFYKKYDRGVRKILNRIVF